MKTCFFLLLSMLFPALMPAQEQHTHADGSSHAAHGDEAATPPSNPGDDHFTAYGESDKYELTLYYPEISSGKEAHLTLYVADFATNSPIENATLKITSTGNPQQVFEVDTLSAGVYEIHTVFQETKKYDLNVQVTHPKGADLIGIVGVDAGAKLNAGVVDVENQKHANGWLLFVGGLLCGVIGMWFLSRRRSRMLTAMLLMGSAWLSSPNLNPAFAHGDDEHGPKAGSGGFGQSVAAPKEIQFLFEILTHPIAVGDYHSATTMFGTVVPSSNGLGAAVAPQNGRIMKINVQVGQTVRAGQTLALMEQNISAPDQVGMAANNSNLAVQLETAKARVVSTKREMERLQAIADIAAARDVQAAEAAYKLANSELQILENNAYGSNASANARNIALVAPISGVVAAFTLAPGAQVISGQTLFTVINLNKVYVEAQVYDRDVAVVHAGNKFLVTCSNDDHKTAEVRLISTAQTMNPGNQSQRILFEMDNPLGEFKIGEFVSVKALDNNSKRQITVPNPALTEINGKTAVFIKTGPEMLVLRYVQTGEDDGNRTLVLKGIEEGEKVVVNGAYEVKMMYLNQ